MSINDTKFINFSNFSSDLFNKCGPNCTKQLIYETFYTNFNESNIDTTIFINSDFNKNCSCLYYDLRFKDSLLNATDVWDF